MGSFLWRDPRSAADLRLKYWYGRRRAEIVRRSRPRLVGAVINTAKDLHLGILLPLVRRCGIAQNDSLMRRYYTARPTDRG